MVLPTPLHLGSVLEPVRGSEPRNSDGAQTVATSFWLSRDGSGRARGEPTKAVISVSGRTLVMRAREMALVMKRSRWMGNQRGQEDGSNVSEEERDSGAITRVWFEELVGEGWPTSSILKKKNLFIQECDVSWSSLDLGCGLG